MAALSLDDFALFARVADLRNLSAVARERDVPPSQVSRALARIEQACGARLVHRNTHGLSLTEEGDSVAAHGAQMLMLADTLEAELDERRGEPGGLVRVATSAAFALVLVSTLQPLRERYPRLRIEIAADDRLVDMARDGIDIAIRTGTPHNEGLVAREIGRHHRLLVASPAYVARHGRPAHPDDLNQHALIANSVSPVINRWPFLVDGQRREVRVSGTLRSDNSGVTLAMALQGLGIARISSAVAAPMLTQGLLLPLLEQQADGSSSPINAVMLAGRRRLPKVQVCVAHFAQWFAANSTPAAELQAR